MKTITYGLKILAGTLTLSAGLVFGSMLSTALKLKGPQMPVAVDLRVMGLWSLVAGVTMALGVAEIARRLRGGFVSRWLAVSWLTYACAGIAIPMEAAFFTTIGGSSYIAVSWVPASLLLGLMTVLLFQNVTKDVAPRPGARAFFASRTAPEWVVRLMAALLAFPLVYFIFGMMVGLVVESTYREGLFGLRLPTLGVIIVLQLARGLIVLLASMPILIAWSDSSRKFWITFSLGLFVLLGLYGLMQGYWLPWGMRGLHALEILADSLVYGWVLARLLLTRERPRVVRELAAAA